MCYFDTDSNRNEGVDHLVLYHMLKYTVTGHNYSPLQIKFQSPILKKSCLWCLTELCSIYLINSYLILPTSEKLTFALVAILVVQQWGWTMWDISCLKINFQPTKQKFTLSEAYTDDNKWLFHDFYLYLVKRISVKL